MLNVISLENFSIIYSKCYNINGRIFKEEESIKILKILGLIE